MDKEKRQIAAVVKKMQEYDKQRDEELRKDQLAVTIAELTGRPIGLVREKLFDVEVQEGFVRLLITIISIVCVLTAVIVLLAIYVDPT
ncbi:MAG: hypothetical protein ACRC62_03705 [Microcoleus sp.]